jgi:hypothetical protein
MVSSASAASPGGAGEIRYAPTEPLRVRAEEPLQPPIASNASPSIRDFICWPEQQLAGKTPPEGSEGHII